MNDNKIEEIVDLTVDKIYERVRKMGFIEIEASGRHAHLSRDVIDKLFGKNYQLTKVKELSQPGQFVSKERVKLIGPKGKLQNVVVLGPDRPHTQVEISKTDAKILGIDAPVKESGSIEGTPGVELMAMGRSAIIKEGVIVADRHIHMSVEDAQKLSLEDGDKVDVEVQTDRPLVFKDVKVRVSDKFDTFMHIDYDEANACNLGKKTLGLIINK